MLISWFLLNTFSSIPFTKMIRFDHVVSLEGMQEAWGDWVLPGGKRGHPRVPQDAWCPVVVWVSEGVKPGVRKRTGCRM